MKKSILAGVVVTFGLATVLMAHGGDGDEDQMMMQKGMMQQRQMMQGDRDRDMMPKGMENFKRGGLNNSMPNPMNMMQNMRKMHTQMMMGMLGELELSKTQKEQISKIVKKSMQNRDKILEAFGKNSFDKEKFIKIMKSKRINMIQSRADMLEEIFKVLNKKQREDFVTLIKARHIMMR